MTATLCGARAAACAASTLLLCGLSVPCLAAPARAAPNPTEIARAAQAAMQTTGARGLAVALIDGGQVRSAQACGVRNARSEPLTPDTVMYGASITKAVFGYLVAMLSQPDCGANAADPAAPATSAAPCGRALALDAPIARLLPQPLPSYGNVRGSGNWGDLDGDARWQQITPRMVLNHATGFANFAFLEPDRKLRIHFTPGSRYAYSGEGIMLLQFGLERGLGLDVEAELQRRLFVPLGLRRTSLKWRADFAENLADGFTAQGTVEPHDERSRVRAADSMDTTLNDLAALAAGMVRGHGLSAAVLDTFRRGTLPITTRSQFPTLQPEAPAAEQPKAAAALGVIAFDGPQGPGWFKGGHNDSTANTLVCLERAQRCLLILSNDVRAEAAFPALVRRLLGNTGAPYRWEYPEHPQD